MRYYLAVCVNFLLATVTHATEEFKSHVNVIIIVRDYYNPSGKLIDGETPAGGQSNPVFEISLRGNREMSRVFVNKTKINSWIVRMDTYLIEDHLSLITALVTVHNVDNSTDPMTQLIGIQSCHIRVEKHAIYCNYNGRFASFKTHIKVVCLPFYYTRSCARHCVRHKPSYRCDRQGVKICNLGWEGKLCDKLQDPCQPNPCVTGDPCVRIRGAYNQSVDYFCRCTSPYTGKNCGSVLRRRASTSSNLNTTISTISTTSTISTISIKIATITGIADLESKLEEAHNNTFTKKQIILLVVVCALAAILAIVISVMVTTLLKRRKDVVAPVQFMEEVNRSRVNTLPFPHPIPDAVFTNSSSTVVRIVPLDRASRSSTDTGTEMESLHSSPIEEQLQTSTLNNQIYMNAATRVSSFGVGNGCVSLEDGPRLAPNSNPNRLSEVYYYESIKDD